jgi:ABC-type branched-subunit amino acid transport system ATPase component
MIRIDSVTIEEFRGIRNLQIEFKGGNFAICGPNGTGKSGIVDALEFGLTGNVSRLSGEGRGDISLKDHGPHVDSSKAPHRARVSITVTIPSLNKTATVVRNVAAPSSPVVTPDDPAVNAILRHVSEHPEIVLSRRELIRYVLATPGKRSEEVQALLHLDTIEKVRAGFQKIANASKRKADLLLAAATDARTNLLRALGITELTKGKLLDAVNPQRSILELPLLREINDSSSLKDGLASQAAAQPQRVPKTQTLRDIGSARTLLSRLSSDGIIASVLKAKATVEALASDPLIATGVTRENFYKTAMAMIEADACPLCDTVWDPAQLRDHIERKIETLKEAAHKRKQTEKLLVPLVIELTKAKEAVALLIQTSTQLRPLLVMAASNAFAQSCATRINALNEFLPIATTISALRELTIVPQMVSDEIAEFEKKIKALPEPTKQDAARDWLTLAQERLEVWREAMRKSKIAKEHADRTRQISDLYAKTSDVALTGLYTEVEKDFAALYGFINRTDEDKFTAKLVPSLGKLGFDVNFYGRGLFPPGAYHSEGHQDGMGLCLYLALMRHVQGSDFTIAILDDVLMSVDLGHRREVCTLLKKEFPKTQFILTTHDPIWLRHMKTERLIGPRSAIQFRNWNVESGPTQWDDRDVWSEIDDYLNHNDVRSAAALLRNYLEFVSSEICHRLRAPVEYRSDAQYQLGELMPAAIRQMKKLYGEAKSAANSWKQKSVVERLVLAEKQFSDLVEVSRAEQWQTNVAIHFNSWDNLVKEDFIPVVVAFQNLLRGFECPDCSVPLYVTPERDTREVIRCDCGSISMNLRRK